ncbi:MAG: serine/threonine-protein kinase [Planctomycetota bacterium]
MPLSPGDRLDEFVLRRRIGEGSFGEVWEAENTATPGARVAVKVPTREDAVRELRREGRIVERLSHPAIVPVLAQRLDHDPPYLVYALVEGPSLADVLRADPITPWAVAARMFRELLQALAHAHQQGVIHRDLKPANILLAGEGDVVLTDFGLGRAAEATARSLSLSTSRSSAEELRLVGTLRYMSPEQAAGQEATVASDLYAAGVILHEMLTGDATRLRFPIHEAPIWLSAIVERATRPDPAQRYQSAEQMIAALDAPVQAARVRSVFSRLRMDASERQVGRNLRYLLLVSTVLLAILLWLFGRDGEWESRQTRVGGASDGTQPLHAVEQGLRGATIAASKRALCAIAAPPDGSVVAAGGLGGSVTLWNTSSRTRLLSTDMPCATRALAFSHDGQRLYAGGEDGTIRVLEVATGRELDELKGHQSAVGSLAVSEDGAMVVSGGWDWTVRVWDAARATERMLLFDGARAGGRPVTWSTPEQGCDVAIRGRRLFASDATGGAHEWDLGDFHKVEDPRSDAAAILFGAHSPDGKRWAAAGSGGTVEVWGEATGTSVRRVWKGSTGGRDAKRLLLLPAQLWSANSDGTLTVWDLPSGE